MERHSEAGTMSGSQLPNAGAAAKSAPPAAAATPSSPEKTLDVVGKVLFFGWAIVTGFLGGEINIAATVMRGIAEIWSGSMRTGAGWSVIIGLCLGAGWFVAGLIVEYGGKGPQRVAKPRKPDQRGPEAPKIQVETRRADPPMAAGATSSKRPAEQAVIDILKKIIADYQHEVVGNQTQCERLIRERCNDVARRSGLETRREAAALVAALQEDLPQRLRSHAGTDISQTAMRNYTTELSRATGLDESAARFAVEAWATALGRCQT
jgi:hypothetical protein